MAGHRHRVTARGGQLFLLQFTIFFCQVVSSQLTAQQEAIVSEQGKSSTQRVSVNVRQAEKQTRKPLLPSWCKDPRERDFGAWHMLSDDEYSEESPYLQCAFPPGPAAARPTLLPAQRRAARAARAGTKGAANTSCATTLQIPKVAMMFLTQGPMPHEPLWQKWLESAAGLVPTLCLANAVCARDGFQTLSALTAVCGTEGIAGKSVYEQQFLFSAYIHARPDYPPCGRESVFYGRDTIVPRLHTRWGDHSTVEAMRRLLQAALRDPANQRFILLSESCVPLYSPVIVYQQLMHEWRSRISACAVPGWDRSVERYNIRMAAGRREFGRIQVERWRKHMHWFSLMRFHAELVANDTEIVDTFARDCFTGYDVLCAEPGNYRFCLPDEHYVSTLLAVYGLDAQTDCMGRLTHASFDVESEHPEHPKTYPPEEVNATLFRNLRGAVNEPIAATNFAKESFRRMEDYDSSDGVWHIPYPDLKQMKPELHLFARKFPAESADVLLQLLTENDDRGERLGIFGGLHRAGQTPYVETNFHALVNSKN